MMEDEIRLVKISYYDDEIGQQIPTRTERIVFGKISSISYSEWFEAGRNGMKPQYKITMFKYDYEEETGVIINDKTYSVYRTYETNSDTIEIYVEEKGGTSGER